MLNIDITIDSQASLIHLIQKKTIFRNQLPRWGILYFSPLGIFLHLQNLIFCESYTLVRLFLSLVNNIIIIKQKLRHELRTSFFVFFHVQCVRKIDLQIHAFASLHFLDFEKHSQFVCFSSYSSSIHHIQ